MKNRPYILNTLLTLVVFAAVLVCTLVRAFLPAVIIPALDMPNVVLLSLAALVLDHYLAPGVERCYFCIPALSAVTFGLLPWAAGFAVPVEALKLALIGGVVFTCITWLYTAMTERMASGPAKKLAPLVSALGLYLAAQCLAGMFL